MLPSASIHSYETDNGRCDILIQAQKGIPFARRQPYLKYGRTIRKLKAIWQIPVGQEYRQIFYNFSILRYSSDMWIIQYLENGSVFKLITGSLEKAISHLEEKRTRQQIPAFTEIPEVIQNELKDLFAKSSDQQNALPKCAHHGISASSSSSSPL